MVMYEPDSDLVQWGLHLLQPGPPFNSIYHGTTDQNGIHVNNGQIAKGSSVRADFTSVENDETIAHALQEELSLVALAEASGQALAAEEQSQASVLAQDWSGSTTEYSNLGAKYMEPSNSRSIPYENLRDGDEYLLELRDDHSAFDSEVCKRLKFMTPEPHVPRINGKIPSENEAISDHQRLLNRLKLYNLVERKVAGDGNCQFGALSDQLYSSPEHHKFVRQHVVNQLRSHPEMYEGYVPVAYDVYLNRMSKGGEWGDHVTLQAAADLYGVKIFILTSFKDTCYIEILPNFEKSTRVITLSFWAEVHYNSIYPEGEFPIPEEKKKSWWHF